MGIRLLVPVHGGSLVFCKVAWQSLQVLSFQTWRAKGLHLLSSFASSKLQQLGSCELLWVLATSAGPKRRQLMFLHRQQKQLLSQFSSCCTAVLWAAIKHRLPEGGRLHWTWKWDRCQIPVQGQCLGNQAMWCSEHRSTNIYFHSKNFFFLLRLSPALSHSPAFPSLVGELYSFNSSPSCFSK